MLKDIEKIINKYASYDLEKKEDVITKDDFRLLAKHLDSLFVLRSVGVNEVELCDCGKSVDKSYNPCCSLKCWHKMFTD